jgi:hypothetical protein
MINRLTGSQNIKMDSSGRVKKSRKEESRRLCERTKERTQ